MAERDFIDTLIALVERDLKVVAKLAPEFDIDDAVVGFHAQQAVEKALKAVLLGAQTSFRRTHDIAELLDLLADGGHPLPPHSDRLDELTPYAVEYRYGLVEPRGIDRIAIRDPVQDVLAWARASLGR